MSQYKTRTAHLRHPSWTGNKRPIGLIFIIALLISLTACGSTPTQATTSGQDGISVSTAKTEMTGYKIFGLQDQFAADALGEGSSISSSLVAQSLVLSAQFLKKKGAISSAPSDLAPNVNPSYAQALLK